MESKNKSLCNVFQTMTNNILAQNQQIKYSWTVNERESECTLAIPKQNENGFDVTAHVFKDQIIVYAGNPHIHFELDGSPENTCQNALGLIRDLLSDDMRICQTASNGKPYRWEIQVKNSNQWITEESIGLLLWNFLGKKTKRYFTNRILPGRLNLNE